MWLSTPPFPVVFHQPCYKTLGYTYDNSPTSAYILWFLNTTTLTWSLNNHVNTPCLQYSMSICLCHLWYFNFTLEQVRGGKQNSYSTCKTGMFSDEDDINWTWIPVLVNQCKKAPHQSISREISFLFNVPFCLFRSHLALKGKHIDICMENCTFPKVLDSRGGVLFGNRLPPWSLLHHWLKEWQRSFQRLTSNSVVKPYPPTHAKYSSLWQTLWFPPIQVLISYKRLILNKHDNFWGSVRWRKGTATEHTVITQRVEAVHKRWMIQRSFWFLFSLILTTDVEEETFHLLRLFTTTRPRNARAASENDDWLQLPVGGQTGRSKH